MNEPLVSVVVSSYNRPLMLEKALASLLHQTYTNLEIILQDDSTDSRCAKVVSDFSDSRILYTRNQPSLGTLRNLREGYRKCTGKYFSTLNDDDTYLPDYIRTMVQAMESNPLYALAFADHYIIDEEGKIDEDLTTSNSAHFGRSVLQNGDVPQPLHVGLISQSIPAMFALFRKELINLNDFPDEVSSGYDYWLTYLALRVGRPIYYNSLKLTCYRVHEGSQTSSFTDPTQGLRSLKYDEYMHKRLLADPQISSIHEPLRSRLAVILSSKGLKLLRIGRRREALGQFIHSCRAKITGRAVGGLLMCGTPEPVLKKVFASKGL